MYCVLGAHARGTIEYCPLFDALFNKVLTGQQQSVECHVQTTRLCQDRQQEVADNPFFPLSVSCTLGQRARVDTGFRCATGTDVRRDVPPF